ncbi:TPA: hypothetical protein DEF17_07510 [bacterium]|nr:MAG: hypothetical protein AUJ18_10130 [Candidatus Hydrogenedentes bacterium CG1_02_42_14]HBW47762.1 hypothetical protein [bacterium]
MKKYSKRKLLFVPSKRDYVRGNRPSVSCILCASRDGNPNVENLILAKDKYVFVTLNLFPYNPGHVMIVPKRHIIDPRSYLDSEVKSIDKWTRRILDVLDEIYDPSGYNIGYNIGNTAGASLEHLHLHIVPRFKNEIGFIDIIGGARVHVDDPKLAAKKLRQKLNSKSRAKKEKR